MSRTIIYEVLHSGGISYLPTKAEALKLAREIRDQDEDPYVDVTASVVTDQLGRRELYCALLRTEGWVKETWDVTL